MNGKLNSAQEIWNKIVLEPYFKDCDNTTLSRPFYMGVSDEYIKSENRIMIIGQEAKGFGLYTDTAWPMDKARNWSIDYLNRQVYRNKSSEYNYTYNNSGFWRLFRFFKDSGISPCWNNIDKLHQTIGNKTVPLTLKMESYFCKQYGDSNKSLIQNEIEICKPNYILFITGPHYTNSMATSFGLDENELIEVRPNIENPITDVTEIFGLGIKVFWTYHPTFLNRKQKLDDVTNKILKLL